MELNMTDNPYLITKPKEIEEISEFLAEIEADIADLEDDDDEFPQVLQRRVVDGIDNRREKLPRALPQVFAAHRWSRRVRLTRSGCGSRVSFIDRLLSRPSARTKHSGAGDHSCALPAFYAFRSRH